MSVVSQIDNNRHGISVPTLCSLVRHRNALNLMSFCSPKMDSIKKKIIVIPAVESMHSDWIIAMIYFLSFPPYEYHLSHDANGTWTWRVLIPSHLDVFLSSIACPVNHK